MNSDTTLAAILTSLGAFDGESWPPYTSHIALELFRRTNIKGTDSLPTSALSKPAATSEDAQERKHNLWKWMFGGKMEPSPAREATARRKMDELNEFERGRLDDFYVRIRYNDRSMVIPGCKMPGKHLEGDESFCTLVCLQLFYAVRRLLRKCRRLSKPSLINLHQRTGSKHVYPTWTDQRFLRIRNRQDTDSRVDNAAYVVH